jgi:hypothetical protein
MSTVEYRKWEFLILIFVESELNLKCITLQAYRYLFKFNMTTNHWKYTKIINILPFISTELQ